MIFLSGSMASRSRPRPLFAEVYVSCYQISGLADSSFPPQQRSPHPLTGNDLADQNELSRYQNSSLCTTGHTRPQAGRWPHIYLMTWGTRSQASALVIYVSMFGSSRTVGARRALLMTTPHHTAMPLYTHHRPIHSPRMYKIWSI